MRTGVAYMGHHNPQHLTTDLREMQALGLDDLFLCAQENDFIYFPGKIEFTAQIAADHGLRPMAIIWGALNLFGGGRSSQFLLEHPQGFQVARDGSHRAAGCYVNPVCVVHIQHLIDVVADYGYAGYFVDEPTPLRDCYCPSCQERFQQWYGSDLLLASDDLAADFRKRCVIDYVRTIAEYCKRAHPQLVTSTCVMPVDEDAWHDVAQIEALDDLGTDIYWANGGRNLDEMGPIVERLAGLCQSQSKTHHEWLQCWNVRQGNEHRVLEMGQQLLACAPDALYVWAWKAQIGTKETSDDPQTCWDYVCQVLRAAKEV